MNFRHEGSTVKKMNDDLKDQTRENVDAIAGAGTSDKAEGSAKETLGRGKEALGAATGNDSLRAEGAKDQIEGKAKGLLGEIKEGAEHLKEKVEDVIHGNHRDTTNP